RLRHPVVVLRRAGAGPLGGAGRAPCAPRGREVSAGSLRARNLRTLAALAGVFLLPLLLAFFTYYGTAWRPAGRVNHGTLLSPPRPLPAVPLTRVRLAGDPAPARATPP